MISLFGTSLGLFAPLAALSIPFGFGLLLYAYRRGGKGRTHLVPTILLLQQLARPISAPQKIRFPLRFFFELLLVLLLAFAAAGLFYEQNAQRVALIIDNSLSMNAQPAGASGKVESIFDRAQQQALNYLSRLGFGAEVEVYATSPALRRLTQGFSTTSQARDAINKLKAVYAEDQLDSVVTQVTGISTADHFVVFSDKDLLIPQAANGSQSRFEAFSARLQSDELDNQAVLGAERLSENDPGFSRLQVTIARFSKQSQGIELRAALLKTNGDALTNVPAQNITLQPNERTTITFGHIPNNQPLLIRLSRSDGRLDALPQDNQMWLAPVSASSGILVISPLSLKELGLEKISTYRFFTTSLADYEKDAANSRFWDSSESPRALIFHRVLPTALPPKSSLFVFPPSDKQLISAKAVQNASVTRWLEGHPITSYLNLPLLQIANGESFQVPPWGRDLILSTTGSIAFVGEQGQARYTAFGFELFPFEGSKSPLLSILTLNALKWFTDEGASEIGEKPYRSLSVSNDTQSVHFQDGESLNLNNTTHTVVPEHPGILQISTKNNESNFRAVNFINERESNLALDARIAVSDAVDANQQRAKVPLTLWLTLFAVALVLVDIAWELWSEKRRVNRAFLPR